MDDKIHMFCLTAAKLSAVLSVQRLKRERFSSEPGVSAAQDMTAIMETREFTHPENEWKQKGIRALLDFPKHGSIGQKKKEGQFQKHNIQRMHQFEY